MKNFSSYCRLDDARISAFDKYLTVLQVYNLSTNSFAGSKPPKFRESNFVYNSSKLVLTGKILLKNCRENF